MSILHDDPAVDYDEAFSGGGNPRSFANPHEPLPCQTPTASDPHPGRFALDLEDDDMTLKQAIADERDRLVSLLGSGVRVYVHRSDEAWGGGESGPATDDTVNVSLHRGEKCLAFENAKTADVLSGRRTLASVGDAAVAVYLAFGGDGRAVPPVEQDPCTASADPAGARHLHPESTVPREPMSYGSDCNCQGDIRNVERKVDDERYDRERADADLRSELRHQEQAIETLRELVEELREEINELRSAPAPTAGK